MDEQEWLAESPIPVFPTRGASMFGVVKGIISSEHVAGYDEMLSSFNFACIPHLIAYRGRKAGGRSREGEMC